MLRNIPEAMMKIELPFLRLSSIQ